MNIFKKLFCTLGFFFFVLIVLSFTDVPYIAYHRLGTSSDTLSVKPDAIVILGGSGMPSPDGLIRTFYAAEAAERYKDTKIIIALPYNEKDSLHQLNLMAHELIVKGIDSLRIKYEPLGFNTRSQAVHIATMCGDNIKEASLLLITSPEHMYRAIRTFKKAGFTHVGGLPAFETPVDEERVKDKEKSPDARVKNLSLRYNVWSYLHYELLVLREYCAVSYYKIKGWI